MRARRARHRRGTVVIAIRDRRRCRARSRIRAWRTSSAPPTGRTRRRTPRSSRRPEDRFRPSARSSAPSTRRSPARRGSSARRCRARSCKKHGTNKQLSKNKSIKDLNKDLKKARKKGYKLRESQPADQAQEEEGQEAPRVQHQAAPALQVHLDPGRGYRLSQQRPRRDPAGPLHRAEVARQADQRPGLRPVQDHQRQEPGRCGLLRLPVPLPERSEPDRGPGPVADEHPGAAAAVLDRHNIPDAGACIRCNLQIQGTGASPDAVTIDAGNTASGDGAPIGCRQGRRHPGGPRRRLRPRQPQGPSRQGARHLRDRDRRLPPQPLQGPVRRRVWPAHLRRGPLADRELRRLGQPATQASIRAPAPTSARPSRRASVATAPSSATATCTTALLGYSGTDGNSVWVHDNDFYDNTMGFSTDVFTAPGHPGFPQDSDLLENNNFYDNNFNTFLPPCAPGQKPGPPPRSERRRTRELLRRRADGAGARSGLGIWIAGGNANVIRNNRFYDNWRRGMMLFAVPDAFVCSDPDNQVAGCNPDGPARRPPRIGTVLTTTRWARRPTAAPTRTASTSGGTRAGSSSTRPRQHQRQLLVQQHRLRRHRRPASRACLRQAGSPPDNLPSDCENSPLPGALHGQVDELLNCIRLRKELPSCPWFTTPPKP